MSGTAQSCLAAPRSDGGLHGQHGLMNPLARERADRPRAYHGFALTIG
jgi:hypothetical protein